MKNRQPDVDIEINYDAELEEFGSLDDAGDARFVRVRVKGRDIVPGSLKLLPPDPEDQTSGDFLACPVEVRKGTEDYTEYFKTAESAKADRTARFRAELDLASIMLAWKTVQEAAKEPRRFLIKVELEATKRYPKEECTRYGRVKINLSTIRWTWAPLTRDKAGAPPVQCGDEQDNTPIELPVDGTDKNGFRLEVERGVLLENGEYEAVKSDFTHYLSPDGKVDDKVVFLDPEPWDPKIQPTQQIVTTWWTKTLSAENDVLGKLPIETSIRVQAFKEHTIKKRVPRRYIPEDLPVLAIREIPLVLGITKWKVRLKTPDPQDAPILIGKNGANDNYFLVKIQIVDRAELEGQKVLKNTELEWKLLPNDTDSKKYPGTVRYGGKDGLTEGGWITDDNGYVDFYFSPNDINSFLFWETQGWQFFGKFQLRRRGAKPEEPPLPPLDSPDDKTAPSIVLDWAPRLDLRFFKLPYFTKEEKLDPDHLPSEQNVAAIDIDLDPAQECDYQNIFRFGGTIKIEPVAYGHAETEGGAPTSSLDDWRLIIGERWGKSSGTGKTRKIAVVNSDLGAANPAVIHVDPGPRAKGTTGGELTLHPIAPVHPDAKSRLDNIVKFGTDLEHATAKSPDTGAKGAGSYTDAAANFRNLSIGFYNQAVEHFATKPQAALIEKCKAVLFTLPSLSSFLNQGCDTWRYLGRAINFHRQAYKRFEAAFNTFYFDVVQWRPVREMMAEGWKKFKAVSPAAAEWGEWLVSLPNLLRRPFAEKLQDTLFKWVLGVFRDAVKDAITRAKNQVTACAEKLEEIATRRSAALEALGTARSRFSEGINTFAQKTEEVMNSAKQIGDLVEAGRKAGKGDGEIFQELQRAGLMSRFETAQQGLQQANAQILAEVRSGATSNYIGATKQAMMAEVEHGYWTARRRSFYEVQKKFEEGDEALGGIKRFAQAATDTAPNSEEQIAAAVKKLQETPENLEAVIPSVTQEAEQFIDKARDQYLQSNEQALDRLRALALPGGLNLPQVDPALASASKDIAALQNTLANNATASDFANGVKDYFQRRNLAGLHRVWEAQRMLVDQAIKDGLKKGTLRGSEEIRQALADAPEPPQSADAAPEEEGFLSDAWNGLKTIATFIDGLFDCIPSMVWLSILPYLKLLIRGVLAMLNFVFRLMERILAKVFQLLVSGFEWLQTTDTARRKLTCLREAAFDAANAAYATGGGPGLGDFFNLPFFRDFESIKKIREGYERFYKNPDEPSDAALDEAIKTGLETNYDDYYPSQFKQGRTLLYGLASRVLDKSTLESPPCDEDRAETVYMHFRATEVLDKGINDYLASGDHSSLSKKGFFLPLWSVFTGDNSWNTRRLEYICDWIGWIGAWTIRIVACVIAIVGCFGFAITAGLVLALLEIASAVSAFSAIVRMMLAAFGFYPYAVSYPRDIMLMPGVFIASILKPAAERFKPDSESDIVDTGEIPDLTPTFTEF